jgi:hypothetical protein
VNADKRTNEKNEDGRNYFPHIDYTYRKADHKSNENIREERRIADTNKIIIHQNNYLEYLEGMPENRIPKLLSEYEPDMSLTSNEKTGQF